ncbi:hypothetical protein MATL_G00133540 [Megalops atlanticus]|uniref:RRM domain-containing protein n=1 Tax=Megalops atlanticus TaxID=7932 RepID=A0A9D3PWX0_MEGAT|nr:hypothetical protein MATL_G00133540 [Megalops atlanticus]
METMAAHSPPPSVYCLRSFPISSFGLRARFGESFLQSWQAVLRPQAVDGRGVRSRLTRCSDRTAFDLRSVSHRVGRRGEKEHAPVCAVPVSAASCPRGGPVPESAQEENFERSGGQVGTPWSYSWCLEPLIPPRRHSGARHSSPPQNRKPCQTRTRRRSAPPSCPAAPQQEQDPTNLYISNLPVSMDEQELENMLKPFGHVISTRILRDANGVSRGVGFARMESTEKCEVVIQHFNGKYLKTPPGVPAPSEPLLCKFADGGQKKRQNQTKYPQNGRPWPREGETSMALTYDPAAMQNGFYSSPYSIATNRMIAQTSITPFIAASPVSTYQVQSTSWMPHQQYVMQPTGAVITPAMDHTMSMQPASMMGPLTQQMNHMSLGTTGTYMTAAAAAAPMQGTYIPQYTPVPPSAVPVEGVVTDAAPQTVAPSSQDASGQQQPLQVENANEHAPAYSYQQSK